MIPTLLITARTVVRQRRDICIPRIAAKADTMISIAGIVINASGNTIQLKLVSRPASQRKTS